MFNAICDHHFRDINFCIFNSCFDQFTIICINSTAFSIFFHFLAKVCFKFCNCFIGRISFCEFIVQFRQLFTFNVVNVGSEFCFFTSQISYKVVFWESNFYSYIITSFGANELIFKTRNKVARTDLQWVGFTLTAIESFAINSTFEVDNCEVALFHLGILVCNNHFRLLFSDVFQLILNLFVSYLSFFFFSVQAFVVTQFNIRAFCYSCFEDEVFTFFKLYLFDFRLGHRNDFIFLQSSCVVLVNEEIVSFIQNSFFTIVHFDDIAWCFTFTEARNVHLRSNAFYRCFNTSRNISSRYFDS